MSRVEPRKLCDCGRNYIFTAPHMRQFNSKVNGKQVCPDCKMDDILNNIRSKK